MFEDPDDPADSQESGGRPMSLLGAVLWMIGAHLIAMWVTLLASWMFGRVYDLMVGVVCQAAGYFLALYAMLRVHAPEARIRDFIGFSRTSLVFIAIAPLVGIAAQFPGSWLQDQLYAWFPRETADLGPLDLFFQLSFPRRVAIAAAATFLGPVAEEVVFRGAAFTSVLNRHRPAAVIGVTALAFALIHPEVRDLPILIAMGLILGHLRWASGSLLPPILLHVAFNAVPFFYLLPAASRPAEEPTPLVHAAVGLAVVLAGVGLAHLAALRRARRE